MIGNAVIDALAEQVGCYRRMAELAKLQHELVRQGRVEQLLALLGERQQIVDRLATFEHAVGPARQRWSEYLRGRDAAVRAKAEQLLAETRRLLEQITTADRDDALVLQQRKLNVGRQVSPTAAAGQVSRNYTAAAYARRPAMVDVQR